MFVETAPLVMTMLTFAVMGGALVAYFHRFRRRTRAERCSFCGAERMQVQVLIRADEKAVGPVYICERCVGTCVGVLREQRVDMPEPTPDPPA